ncbi:hypothetical protein BDV97DRAFT_356937 [Delphinella strobiligena]|nr:hypothetical protein BDV97DRAFT_356937 [Delphinella strobiligena]
MDQFPNALVDLLNNTLVLRQTAPYVPIDSMFALSATCKSLRSLIYGSPETFRYLDLSCVKSAITDANPIDNGGNIWRSQRMDESLTEEDFFSGPLRGIFCRLYQKNILGHVKTLILDGMSVPAELVREIIAEDRYNVKILSIREVKNMNERKLQQVLHYAVRPSRAKNTPKLKALYYFSPKDGPPMTIRMTPVSHDTTLSTRVMSSEGAQIGAEWNQRSEAALCSSLNRIDEKWYSTTGKVMRAPSLFWAETLQACQGIIAFDVVLCRGPRHDSTRTPVSKLLPPGIATIALSSKGCESCASCPEKPAVFGQDPVECFPLLAPPPSHASTIHAAQHPRILAGDTASPALVLRCEDCLRGRWCERCNKWWCEDCYEEPVSRALPTELQQVEIRQDLQRNGWDVGSSGAPVKGVHRDCFDCGRTCNECKDRNMRRCQSPGCNSEYCFVHAEGSSSTRCDWCGYRGGRRTRDLY